MEAVGISKPSAMTACRRASETSLSRRLKRETGSFTVCRLFHGADAIAFSRGCLLTLKSIEPESFASGLLNFSPPDIRSVAAVRSDRNIRRYAEKISSLLEKEPSRDRDREMLAAMIDAHEKSEVSNRIEKIFEVVSWIVKPLHYAPGVDAALSIVEM
jgi:hypothetical protein